MPLGYGTPLLGGTEAQALRPQGEGLHSFCLIQRREVVLQWSAPDTIARLQSLGVGPQR